MAVFTKRDIRMAVQGCLSADWGGREVAEVALGALESREKSGDIRCGVYTVLLSGADRRHYKTNPTENLVGIVTRCCLQLIRDGHTVVETKEQAIKEMRAER